MTNKFCILTTNHLYLNTKGEYALCCTSDDFDNVFKSSDNSNLTLKNSRPEDIINNPTLLEIRKKMLRGEFPSQCQRCKQDENCGVKSRREFENEKFCLQADNITSAINERGEIIGLDFQYLDFRVSNLCNLECAMCSPQNSSKWEATVAKNNHAITINHKHTFDDFEIFLQKIDLNKVTHVHLAGGEPLIMKSCYSLLNYFIKNNLASKITLSFNTNLTIIPDWIDLLEYFKETNLYVSIDGVGKLNNYIRLGSDWSEIVKNLNFVEDNFSRLKISNAQIYFTVSAFNILHLKEIFTFCAGLKYFDKIPHLFEVTSPTFMSFRHISPHSLNRALADISSITSRLEKLELRESEKILLPQIEAIRKSITKGLNDPFEQDFDKMLQKQEKMKLVQFIKYFDHRAQVSLNQIVPELSIF